MNVQTRYDTDDYDLDPPHLPTKRKPGWGWRRLLFWASLLIAILFTFLFLALTTLAGLAASSQFPAVVFYGRFLDMSFGLAQTLLFFWLYILVVYLLGRFSVDYPAAFALSYDHPPSASPRHVLARARPGCCAHSPHEHKRVLSIVAPFTLLLICCVAAMTVLFAVDKSDPDWPTGLFPVLAFLVLLGSLFVPFLPPFPLTRMAFSRVLGKVLCAMVWPFFGFDFAQLIVADCLTSASLTLYQLELVGCFTFTGEFTRASYIDVCSGGSNALVSQPIMYAFPFWIRFVQCVYMSVATRHLGVSAWEHRGHLLNAGKYMSGIVAVLSSFASQDLNAQGAQFWHVFYLAALVVKTVYCILWDTYVDFDLGHVASASAPRGERFPFFLRKERAFPSVLIYYWLILSNAVMRCSWAVALSTTVPYNWGMLMAVLEIFRRAQWMIFRIEVKHFELKGKDEQADAECERLIMTSSVLDTDTSKVI